MWGPEIINTPPFKSQIPSDFIINEEQPIHVDFKRVPRPLRKKEPYLGKTIKIGQLTSLNVDIIDNQLLLKKESKVHYLTQRYYMQWVGFFIIAVTVGLIAVAADLCIRYITDLKFKTIIFVLEDQSSYHFLNLSVWIFVNVGPMFLGSFIVTYWQPTAAGSGVSLVNVYLNGIIIPNVLSFKTLIVKIIGLICTMVAGVICGKEGPMTHVGAIVGAIISEGRIKFFQKDIQLFRFFREDHNQRNFVCAGAACGISSAFGSSVGAVMYSLEEGSSIWNQTLTWQIFVATIVTSFVCSELFTQAKRSLITIETRNTKYSLYEIPAFLCIGILGGLTGALWNYIFTHLSYMRFIFFKQKWLKVMDACIIAGLMATVGYTVVTSMKVCTNNQQGSVFNSKMFCGRQYNNVASLWVNTPQNVMSDLMNGPSNAYSLVTLGLHAILFFTLSAVTFGTSCSNGTFIPSLLIGAVYGRFIIVCVKSMFPSLEDLDEGKYALVGATAHLTGVIRLTISLAIIVVGSNNSFSFPIIITILAAKWTGDFFNEGLFTGLITFKSYPFLHWETPPLTHHTWTNEFMTPKPYCMRVVEDVQYVMEVLSVTEHNGFPVVDETKVTPRRFGKLRGIILRDQIIAMLIKKMFVETVHIWDNAATFLEFEDLYLRKPNLRNAKVTYEEMNYRLDFKPIMNDSPYSSNHLSSLPRTFRLFKKLCLRHLPIVDDNNEVVGIVTRKDLAVYKTIKKGLQRKLQYLSNLN